MGMPIIEPCTITKEKAVGDIISSIAMQEMALAHILNAESEKLQLIVNLPNVTVEQIFLANASVKNTINTISRLEMQLQAKLDLFKCIICK